MMSETIRNARIQTRLDARMSETISSRLDQTPTNALEGTIPQSVSTVTVNACK